MGPVELSRWQWDGYPRYHTRRASLLLHLFSVPIFWAGTLLVITAIFGLRWPFLVAGLGCMLLALVTQGRGHKLEPTPPVPFTGPWNFVARFCLEQWLTFPRFVLSGGWWANWQSEGK